MDDILPAVILSLITAGVAWLVILLSLPDLATLVIQVVVGAVVYCLLSFMFKRDDVLYLKELFFNNMRK